MELFNYQSLWVAYILALSVLGVSGYLIIQPIPYRWIKWNLLVAIMVFLVAPIQTHENWMIPGAIYFLFEHYFIGNADAVEILYQLFQHVAVAVFATSMILFGLHQFAQKQG